MEAKSRSHSYLTLGAIASVAFIVACVAHEAVGHGGGCLALGRHITVLTSVYFRCSEGGPLTDAAGPLMNLAVGIACWIFLRGRHRLSASWRLFFVFAMAFNLFWGAGYFIFSAMTNGGDWAFVLRDLALEPRWLWRCAMGLLGTFLYYASMRLVASHLPTDTPLLLPYLSAGLVSCLAAFFFVGPTLPALREAAQESFGAGVGLLMLVRLNSRRAETNPPVTFVDRSDSWLVIAVIVIVAFVATLGRGFIYNGN